MTARPGRYCLPVFALLLCLQGTFWQRTHHRLPDLSVVPNPPGRAALEVMSFGDREFLFRAMAFLMGNAGDTFGRTTPLYKYDLKQVRRWFSLLDDFNHDSNLLPSLAAYYYSQTQRREEARHMVYYLKEHALKDMRRKWWWLVQATYIALHRVEDSGLALKVATPLATAEGVPAAMRQLPALVHEQRGEFGDALYIMQTILDLEEDIPPEELHFMRYFIEERIDRLDALGDRERQRLLDGDGIPPKPE